MDIRKQNREYLRTTNRAIYNKLRKIAIIKENDCYYYDSFSKYHRGDLDRRETYCYWKDWQSEGNPRFKMPNWKLTSKNSKQWMDKGLIKQRSTYGTPDMLEKYKDDYDIKW